MEKGSLCRLCKHDYIKGVETGDCPQLIISVEIIIITVIHYYNYYYYTLSQHNHRVLMRRKSVSRRQSGGRSRVE
jgi:hypothetical protein